MLSHSPTDDLSKLERASSVLSQPQVLTALRDVAEIMVSAAELAIVQSDPRDGHAIANWQGQRVAFRGILSIDEWLALRIEALRQITTATEEQHG